jgi:type II secretion system protein I
MMQARRHHRARNLAGELRLAGKRKGFTLLEIILSLAILAGALAALGEVMRLADRNAQMVRDESQAQILASSVMDELLSGARTASTVNQAAFDYNTDPPWVYSIAFDQTPYEELVLARVRVEQQLPPEQQPAHFDLVRWFPNPDYIATDTSQQSTTSSSSSSSSSGSGSSGTGTQSSGGLQ